MAKLSLLFAGLVALVVPVTAHAQASTPDVGAFAITPQAGQWVVLVASFMGEQSGQLAYDFTLELRQHYHLNAYIYNRSADQRREAEADRQKTIQHEMEIVREHGGDPEQVHLHVPRIHVQDQYAVVIGGYPDVDAAHDALLKIRKLPPPSKRFMDCIAHVQDDGRSHGAAGPQYLNPFERPMAIPNPAIPHQPRAFEPDPFWKKLNENESYSLLKCRKPWTLVILELQGATVVQTEDKKQSLLEKLFTHDKAAEYLDATASQVHELAKALHEAPQLRLETYVLHTRSSSILTVGGFDSPNDPELKAMQQKLAAMKLIPQRGAQFHCFEKPLPMQVPRY